MKQPLRILHLEDSETDSRLVQLLLSREGIPTEVARTESRAEFEHALVDKEYDLIMADCTLPGFGGMHALQLAKEVAPQIPFIFVSGTIGEEVAIESLRNGATDYVLKDRLSRLGPAVRRAVAEAEEREKTRAMEMRLRRAQQLEAIGTLAGGVAHDFNNILTIIMGHVALLTMDKPDSEQVLETAATIKRAAQRGAELVQQLSAFARKADSQFTSLNLNRQVEETVDLIRESLPPAVKLDFHPCEKLPEILADPGQIERVLINLITNAKDAMPKGGIVTLETGLERAEQVAPRSPAEGKHYVALRVVDNGTGMDEETRQHIFEPFFTTKPRGKGTGLGLSVVYGLVQSHSGVVDVQSELGKGTTVSLYFPPSGVTEEMSAGRKKAEENAPPGTETVLIVEDESEVRYFLKIIFESAGYRVLEAGDPVHALKLFREQMNGIALVFSDIGLPQQDGFELCAQLRRIKPSIKTILCSGYDEGRFKTQLSTQRINGFVPKPYDKNAVLNTARAVLDQGV